MRVRIFSSLFVLAVILATVAVGQKAAAPAAALSDASAANELAKRTVEAHGGDKFKAMKTLVIRGSADVTSSAFTQAFPGAFSMVMSGEKYVLDIQSVQSFKQSFDGTTTFSSIRGLTLPPITRLGLPMLQKLGLPGYAVASLPPESKKRVGFRMTAPDDVYTDFFIDEKTGQVSGFESRFDVNGSSISTSAVIDKFRTVDGVVLPEKYSQRFDLGQFTAYANFKVKEIVINREIDDSVFAAAK